MPENDDTKTQEELDREEHQRRGLRELLLNLTPEDRHALLAKEPPPLGPMTPFTAPRDPNAN